MKKRQLTALVALVLSGTLALAGCGSGGSGTREAPAPEASSSSQSDGKGAGFEEIPIPPDDQQKGPLNIGTVFFQPIDMEPASMGLKAADASLHLEADIHALPNNNLGYAKGEFVPDLTVNYTIQNKDDPNDKQIGRASCRERV